MARLTPAELLAGPVLEVAPRLLGARFHHAGVTLRLTEVEAYAGPDDPGSHAHRGPTPRTRVMFGPAGRLYVYFTYGMHHCANLVCGPEGEASAVLLRAGEVVAGRDLARERRPGSSDRDLARGPARLCRALALDLAQDGADAAGWLEPADPPVPPEAVATGPRVGLRRAADRPWRFWLAGEPSVSAYRPAAVRRPG
ncbi:DNA-3-methyladenine glycosylase [Nocardioides scoriae]|uniref:Putative 3-methyladenine DNA glycosylase n=1 Tax=Nocardioides scoriae TaxID=642780 RepID=A0A1H1PL34_9ACTN|nr:DNA-3-methyladenine glycosylase [Nocardioides scoriae]SDS11469.1 DNA-3-methyladenine glycosylase [Nocardioides scoriae]